VIQDVVGAGAIPPTPVGPQTDTVSADTTAADAGIELPDPSQFLGRTITVINRGGPGVVAVTTAAGSITGVIALGIDQAVSYQAITSTVWHMITNSL